MKSRCRKQGPTAGPRLLSPDSVLTHSRPHALPAGQNIIFFHAPPPAKSMIYLRRKRALTPAGDTGSGPDDALSPGQHRLTRATTTSPQWVPGLQTACSLHGSHPSAQSPSKSPHPQSPCDGLKAHVALTSVACLSPFSPDLAPRLPWPGTRLLCLPQRPSDTRPARPAPTAHVKAQARPNPHRFHLPSAVLSPLGGHTATSSPCLLCTSVFRRNVLPTEHRLLSGFPLTNTRQTLRNKRTPHEEACDGKRARHGQRRPGNLHGSPASAGPGIRQTQLLIS